MNSSDESLFQALRNRSSDENSKKIEKRKQLNEHKRKSKTVLTAAREMDMKPVKVLVERTKFNEMHSFDRSNNKSIPLKLVNGVALASKKSRKLENKSQKKSRPKATHLSGLFKVRKCFVKIPKDKVLIRQLQKQRFPVTLKRRPRGRPKKQIIPVELSSSPADSHEDLKRKTTTEDEESSPSKRKLKDLRSGFFINVNSLTRTPSPRRKITTKRIEEQPKKVKAKKPVTASTPIRKLSLVALRHKFGSRFFKSYVKVKRYVDPTREPFPQTSPMTIRKKKKNSKNLSVTFMETVEIFGETSDSEDWIDYDDGGGTPSPLRGGSRLKRIDIGTKPSSTSTPCGGGADSSITAAFASGERMSGGILNRKEKITFSPLKEDETSPRKEQLKWANEKITRFVQFADPATEEDDQPETTTIAPTTHPEADKETSADASGTEEDERHSSIDANASSTSISSNAELLALSSDLDSSATKKKTDVVAVTSDQEESPAKENSLEKSIESTATTSEKDKENDSYKSAEEAESKDAASVTSKAVTDTNVGPEEDVCEKFQLQLDDTDQEDENHQTDDATKDASETKSSENDDTATNIEDQQPEEAQEDEDDNDEDDDVEEGECNAAEDNISNHSEQHFEDASELVATVIMNSSIEEDRNEAEAVLNDVCQIAAAESAALLNEEDVDFNSRAPNDDDDDDDFTSVLTHPEVERSLQSAASTLVPNSQEIVVAEAAAVAESRVTEVDDAEDTFASVVAEVERFTKDVNPEIYSADVGITGADVMMDNVQASNSLDDIFDDDDVNGQSHMFLHFPDDIISSLRMSSGNTIDIGHDKSLPIQVIETEVMAIPNEPDLIFDKPLGTTASILGTSMSTTSDHGHSSAVETTTKMSLGRIFQSVKSYVMSPPSDKNAAALQD